MLLIARYLKRALLKGLYDQEQAQERKGDPPLRPPPSRPDPPAGGPSLVGEGKGMDRRT